MYAAVDSLMLGVGFGVSVGVEVNITTERDGNLMSWMLGDFNIEL
jgi:hypothetical protein